jgi:hypothetical protein
MNKCYIFVVNFTDFIGFTSAKRAGLWKDSGVPRVPRVGPPTLEALPE